MNRFTHLLKPLLWLVVLAAMATFTWWLQHLVEPIAAPAQRSVGHVADYTMETFSVLEMNAAGETRYRLQAELMEHFADDGSARLVKPQVRFFSRERVPWTLVAEEGTVTANHKEIHLNGAVLIERLASTTQAPLRLMTRNVLLHPHDEVAETREQVMLQDSLNTTRAVGMRVNLNNEHVQLLSQVQGRYAPR